MLEAHIVRYSFRQAHFDTATVGHFIVVAKNAASAVKSLRDQYPSFVKVEYVAPGPAAPPW